MLVNVTVTPAQAEAFDRLLDVIAEEIVERYLAEAELDGVAPSGTGKGAAE